MDKFFKTQDLFLLKQEYADSLNRLMNNKIEPEMKFVNLNKPRAKGTH